MMKKLYILFLTLPVLVFAQSQDQNYIKNTTYKVATTSPISNPNPEQAAVTVQYFDGLGRPVQQVAHKQSNTGKDIIVHTEYDAFGRKTHDYLPYVRSSASLSFDPDAQVNTLGFYATNNASLTGNPHFETTTNPYSEKVLEASPLSRVFEQAAPGNPWEKTNEKTIRYSYQTNAEDEVVYFKANTSWSSSFGLYTIELVKDGFYAPNELYKIITKDENWTSISDPNHTTEEFKNKKGQVVLKRTYNNKVKHDTYYVYDVYDNLTYIIPPKVDVNQIITQSILDGLCYQYKYDQRNRKSEKKLPGKAWEFILYNTLDRPVATSTLYSPYGNGSATPGWLITKYDVFGRVVYTGWMAREVVNSYKRKEIQDLLNNGTYPLFETKTTSPVAIDGVQTKYTNVAFPTEPFELLTVNYYDNYDFPGAPLTLPDKIFGDDVLTNVKSLPTGTWTRFLDNEHNTGGESTYMLYDLKGRQIAIATKHYLGGETYTESKLDFEGKVLYTETKHRRTSGVNYLKVRNDFQYTPQGRMKAHLHKVNYEPSELIAYNVYDELGQLISKQVGGQDTINFIGYQKVNYQYNNRGWLKAINDINDFNSDVGHFEDLFSFKIHYNTVTKKNSETNVIEEVEDSYGQNVKKLFNGNIAETYWRTLGDNTLRKYSNHYDDLNRLKNAYYQKPEETIESTDAYNESLSYDKNGNISRLSRTGNYDGNDYTLMIDHLEYFYPDNSNLLMKVTDSTNNPLGFKDDSDGTNDSEDDYVYDEYGNMRQDENKGIERIDYNHLNLPVYINFGDGKMIYYFYDANGAKLKKAVFNNQDVTETDYFGIFQYENTVLQFFSYPEGYVKHTPDKLGRSTFDYVYNYKDHLGNIRLSYALDPATQVLKILEENHYYPFGLKHTNYNSGKRNIKFEEDTETKIVLPVLNMGYKYKYNGQEFQDELGLNWYTYRYRNYDPAIGRFMGIDPVSEEYFSISTFQFAHNNPIWKIEIEGLEGKATNGETDIINHEYIKVYSEVYYTPNGKKMIVDVEISSNLYERSADSNEYVEGNSSEGNLVTYDPIFDPSVGLICNIKATNTTLIAHDIVQAYELTSGLGVISKELLEKGIKSLAKNIRNPFGKKGGKAHQEKTKETIEKMKEEGFDQIETEVMVSTPGGNKSKRFIDIRGTNSKTGKTKDVQIGKRNKRGDPVSRERKALDDIENATGERPDFVPYNYNKEYPGSAGQAN